ncbi:MAG: hypothetical protein J6X36_01755 [Lachnospiraceae bacterium]|nr:hypothetical protein [Lachnospiraceae bacterium]
MKKTIIGTIAFLSVLISTTITAKASTYSDGPFTYFFNQYVDSNQYTYVCSSYGSGWVDHLQVYVGAIYKANGSESNYKKVYVMPSAGGNSLDSRLLKVGNTSYYSIPAAYQGNDVTSQLFAMGHNPSLDCQITGLFSSD